MVNFIHPCPNTKLTSKFGYRTIFGKREWHQGVDFAQKGNVNILASANGTVRDIWPATKSSYGNVIFLQHNINGKRMDTVYAHLKSVNVKKGQQVKQGDLIGYMGNTGRSSGQHLHFEIHNGPWVSGQPNAVDPMGHISTSIKPEVKKSLKSGSYKTSIEAERIINTLINVYGLNPKYNTAYKEGNLYYWRVGSMDESQAKTIRQYVIDSGLAKIVHLI